MRFGILVFGCGVVAAIGGCGGDGVKRPAVAAVSGKVIYQGKPVEAAEVTFLAPKAPQGATGTTNAQGEFKLSTFGKNDGAIIGENVVTISKWEIPEFARKQYADSLEYESARKAAEQQGLPTEPKPLLPVRYSQANQSGLNQKVEAGKSNVFTFELTD